jgi:hypothetical protein
VGGASWALAPGADFEGAPKRRSLTGHTLIRSIVAWSFPHSQTKRVAKEFFLKFGCIGFSLFWCVLVFTYVYLRSALCLLLQILLFAGLDIKLRDGPTVSWISSMLSQYCKASHYFANFYVLGGAPTICFAPVVPWAKAGAVWEHGNYNTFSLCITIKAGLKKSRFVLCHFYGRLFLMYNGPSETYGE